jgi:Rrf2 family transcriptional regulator, cysteine metabolism repressor
MFLCVVVMRLSVRGEYACLALLDLCERFSGGWVRVGDVSLRRGIPVKFLEQILLVLKRGGYVRSRRGVGGGYCLSKNPGEITVAEIVRLMDGALAPVGSVSEHFHEQTPISQNKALMGLFRDVRDYTAQKLESTTFADLM